MPQYNEQMIALQKLTNNFSLYKYVNHTSNRLGHLKTGISEIADKIDNVSNCEDEITWFNMYEKVNVSAILINSNFIS